MVDHISEEEKIYFSDNQYIKEYEIEFPEIGMTLKNDDIRQESVTIQESIIDGQDFVLGGCISSSVSFKTINNIEEDLNGLLFYVRLTIKGKDTSALMGTYRVDSAKKTDENDGKEIVGYDCLHDISADVSNWYEDLFKNQKNVTLSRFREQLLDYFCIPYITQELPNDSIMLEKTIDAQSGLSGIELLRMICVINAGFGRMNRHGFFEIINLGSKMSGLYPENSLFPNEDIYPEDSASYIGNIDGETSPECYSAKYEEYVTKRITSVNIQSDGTDIAVSSETDQTNPYLITGNYLLYMKSTTEIKEIGHNIYLSLKDIQYRPCTIEADGMPYMEIGDPFSVLVDGKTISSICMSRTITGTQNIRDRIEADGREYLESQVSIDQKIASLNGKTMRISQTIEGITQEIEDANEQISTMFEQTNSQIVLKVDNKGNIALVELGVDADTGTVFKVGAKNINLTAEQAISLMAGGNIDLKGKSITITSDNFSIDSAGNAVFSGELNAVGGTFNRLEAANGNIIIDSLPFFTTELPYIECKGAIISQGLSGDRIVAGISLEAQDILYEGNIRITSTKSDCGVVVGRYGHFRPNKDDQITCGAPNYKWTDLYSTNGTIHTSDRQQKKNIEEISEEQAEQIISGMKPVWYQFKNGKSDRRHSGLIAQDVEEFLEKNGIDSKDFAALCISEVDGKKEYGIRYEEFISILIRYCQLLKKENKSLNSRLSQLEKEVFGSELC